jgi:hypothetical protein
MIVHSVSHILSRKHQVVASTRGKSICRTLCGRRVEKTNFDLIAFSIPESHFG